MRLDRFINRKVITRTVLILSAVSFFNDVASEMLYPVMPIYLRSIGFSILLIGILEGVAEAIAGLSKGYFGNLSDARNERIPYVRFGYLLNAISKPMLAISALPIWVFISRTLDRLGKGIRTGARDAILSDEATIATKGQVFGFHRGLDTFGAVLGPSLALLFLYFLPGKYKLLFLIAFLPGLVTIMLTLILKERGRKKEPKRSGVSFISFLSYIKKSPVLYKKLIACLLFFTLFNSSDAFLLLKIKSAGFGDLAVILVYIFYNFIYALSSYPIGILADRIGMKKIFITGLILFALVYSGMAVNKTMTGFIMLFIMYGLYAASTEGISKAWITNITDRKDTATAIGAFTALQSISIMLASSIAGLIWYKFGPAATFITSAVATAISVLYLVSVRFKHDVIHAK